MCDEFVPSLASGIDDGIVIFEYAVGEPIGAQVWETRRQAEIALFDYINGFYNPRRRHSALNGKGPLRFERRAA